LTEAAAEVGITKLGDAASERRRRRKKAAKGQPSNPERLISIEVNRRHGGESGTEINVFVSDQGFPVNSAQAVGLIGFIGSYLASAHGAVPPPSDEDAPRESSGGQPQR
jgi:hypothetical protein